MTTGLSGNLLCGWKALVLAELKLHKITITYKHALLPKI